jgi:hypothetical protein
MDQPAWPQRPDAADILGLLKALMLLPGMLTRIGRARMFQHRRSRAARNE